MKKPVSSGLGGNKSPELTHLNHQLSSLVKARDAFYSSLLFRYGLRETELTKYLVAVAIFIIAFLARLLLIPDSSGLPYITFYPAILICAFVCGTRPSLLLVLLSTFAGQFAFTPPLWSFKDTSEYASAMLLFALSGVLVCTVIEEIYRGVAAASDVEDKVKETIRVLENDIRARAQTEDALRESEHLFRSLFEQAGVGVSLCDAVSGHFIKTNQRYCDIVGYSLEELRTLKLTTITHADDMAVQARMTQAMLAGEVKEYHIEKRYLKKDGGVVWVDLTCTALWSPGESPTRHIAVVQDITEKKTIEAALQLSEQRWKYALDVTEEGVWDIDLGTNRIFLSKRCKEMLGYTEDEIGDSMQAWASLIHPDDIDCLMAMRQRSIDGTDRTFTNEHRKRCKDGSWRWVMVKGMVVDRDAAGNAMRLIGTYTDIHASKEATDRLALADMVFQSSSEAIMIADEQDRLVSVNPAFTKVTGYALEDVRGQSLHFLDRGLQSPAFYKEMQRQLDASGLWQGELRGQRKNGEVFAEWLTINSSLNADQSLHRRVAIFSDITKLKESEELVWQEANFDALTGLPNRRMFYDRLQLELKKSSRTGLPLAMMFMDLDRFKEINDSLGHDMGDLLLKETAKRLRRCVRETDIIARLGGDEFTVILSALDDTSVIERVASDILFQLSQPYQLGAEKTYVTASIGITLYPQDAMGIDELMKNADRAMYAAKSLGRNRASYFTISMQEAAEKRLRLINDLRQAIAGNQLELHYQPIVDLKDGKVHKAEALLRWHHPHRGMVSPAEFIPIAEETGLIVEIGDWVFENAVAEVIRLRAQQPDFQISINKSAVQFRAEQNVHTHWFEHIARLDLPGNALVVEITEGLLLDPSETTQTQLHQLNEAGIEIAIDDFGTGYSSLAYIKNFSIDYIKIDQSFTRNLAPDSSDLALCEAIIVMAHKLGMRVIAEGVETAEQCALLTEAGCDYGQGYLFSRPLPSEQFMSFLGQPAA
ncbi:MAG TPA: EAL domain-containing protein [Methylophilaceae bacterium]|nr:EAL domain-containing protein [Methylophilaceae bacterium]